MSESSKSAASYTRLYTDRKHLVVLYIPYTVRVEAVVWFVPLCGALEVSPTALLSLPITPVNNAAHSVDWAGNYFLDPLLFPNAHQMITAYVVGLSTIASPDT